MVDEGRTTKKALLHDSADKLKWIASMHPDIRVVHEDANSLFPNAQHEDFPISEVTYRHEAMFFAASRMFVEPTLWVTDALIAGGVRRIIKLRTFVTYDDTVSYGDIMVPDAAVALQGAINAYVCRGVHLVNADEHLTGLIVSLALAKEITVRSGRILTYTLGSARKKEDVEYDPDACRYRTKCLGLEMECSGLFAVSAHYRYRGVRSAAILVCNRKWSDVKAKRFSAASKDPNYRHGYWKAVELALDALSKA
jgi:purine-nucleoside phosphorylase